MIRAGRLVRAGLLAIALFRLPEGKAHAARMTVTLAYAAASGCPDVSDFKAVILGRLGYDPFVEGSPDHVFVRLERRAGGMDGRIEWRDAAGKWTGEQTFPSVSSDCSGVARVLGFALALQIQFLATGNPAIERDGPSPGELGPPAEAAGGRPVPTPSVAPSAGPEASKGLEGARPAEAPAADESRVSAPVPPDLKAAASSPPADRSGPTFAIGAGPSLGLGYSSRPLALGRLFGALAWQHLSIEVAAQASLTGTVRRADGAGFTQRHLFGSAGLCAGSSRWNGCLLANVGEIRMAGQDIEHPTSATVALVQVGLRVAFVQPLGSRAFFDAHADGLINVTRWTGRLDEVPVWTAPRTGAAVGIDAGVRFR